MIRNFAPALDTDTEANKICNGFADPSVTGFAQLIPGGQKALAPYANAKVVVGSGNTITIYGERISGSGDWVQIAQLTSDSDDEQLLDGTKGGYERFKASRTAGSTDGWTFEPVLGVSI